MMTRPLMGDPNPNPELEKVDNFEIKSSCLSNCRQRRGH
jgi:hypothetical protein